MGYKPKTSQEINLHKIETTLKKVKQKKIPKIDAAKILNKRFVRLESENIGMYEELYPKYIKLFKIL